MSYISVVDRPSAGALYCRRAPNLTRTLALIKPDAFARRLTGKIIDAALDAGLTIVAMRCLNLNRAQAEAFYAVHRERPFFASLVEFMTSGTTVAMVLEGDDAVPRWRDAMGATDPAEAAAGTIRRRFAESIEHNCSPRLRLGCQRRHRDRLLLQRPGSASLTIPRYCAGAGSAFCARTKPVSPSSAARAGPAGRPANAARATTACSCALRPGATPDASPSRSI